MTRIYIPATRPEDWKPFLADPRHWKSHHSAKCLAYCWQESQGFPEAVKKAFNRSGLFFGTNILLAIPEYKVSIPGGGRQSQPDLFVLAKSNDQLISIIVEGKASEPFGKLVEDWLKDASPGRQVRLNFLCSQLGLDPEGVLNIRYQFLHRTVSALITARRFNATIALMLVHSFSSNDQGFDDYQRFAGLFGTQPEKNQIYEVGDLDGLSLSIGWVSDHSEYGVGTPDVLPIKGTVIARQCESCGHHELGIETDRGAYYPLKPGMKAELHD